MKGLKLNKYFSQRKSHRFLGKTSIKISVHLEYHASLCVFLIFRGKFVDGTNTFNEDKYPQGPLYTMLLREK